MRLHARCQEIVAAVVVALISKWWKNDIVEGRDRS